MWFCPKNESINNISTPTIIAIAFAVFSLVMSVGVARWSWFIVDEQIRLRGEINKLIDKQDQVNTQYEFWLKQVQTERAAIKAEAAPAIPAPKK